MMQLPRIVDAAEKPRLASEKATPSSWRRNLLHTDVWPADFDELLRAHLSGIASADPVPDEVPLVDLGLDSAGLVSLLADLEDRFCIAFPDELIGVETFYSAASLWAVVRRLRSVSL